MNKGTRGQRRWFVGVTGGAVMVVGLSVGLLEGLSGGAAAASSSPSLTAKASLAQAQADQRASATRAPKTAQPLAQAAPGAVEWPTGIQDIRQPPEPGVTQTNEWDGVVNGQDVAVHAGAVKNGGTANQGVIVVTVYDPSVSATPPKSYYAPTLAGPFKIISAAGDILTVQGSGPITETFNAATDAFGA
ncbi:MAG: hypothetical protein ACRDX8_05600 [Acidimicrobiales bacterium]